MTKFKKQYEHTIKAKDIGDNSMSVGCATNGPLIFYKNFETT